MLAFIFLSPFPSNHRFKNQVSKSNENTSTYSTHQSPKKSPSHKASYTLFNRKTLPYPFSAGLIRSINTTPPMARAQIPVLNTKASQ